MLEDVAFFAQYPEVGNQGEVAATGLQENIFPLKYGVRLFSAEEMVQDSQESRIKRMLQFC